MKKYDLILDCLQQKCKELYFRNNMNLKGFKNPLEIDTSAELLSEYKDFGIELTVDKVESIVAGKSDTSKDYVVEVKLETAGDSFIAGRPIDFTVDGGEVKLKGSAPSNTSFDNIVGDYDDEFEVNLANAYKTDNDLKVKTGYFPPISVVSKPVSGSWSPFQPLDHLSTVYDKRTCRYSRAGRKTWNQPARVRTNTPNFRPRA